MSAIPSTKQDLGKVIREVIEAISVGDVDRFAASLSDRVVYHLTGSHPFSQRTEGKQRLCMLITEVRQFFADDSLRYHVDRIIVSENTVVSTFKATGKMTNGKTYDNDYCAIWDFVGDKVVHITEFFDSHHVAQMFQP